MKKFEVTILRSHKSSRFNCVAVFPELCCSHEDEVIKTAAVRRLINNKHDRNLTVYVYPEHGASNFIYKIKKAKVILS